MTQVVRLFITPQTHTRTVKEERWMLSPEITDEYLIEVGKKRVDKLKEAGKESKRSINDYVNRRNQILRYFKYKRAVKEEALEQRFVLPEEGAWIKFYMPMPKSWSKKKRNEKCFTQHKSMPDADNLIKALFDSLFNDDSRISDYRATKFWYDAKEGFIEIETGSLPEPKGYTKFEREEKLK